MSLDEETCSAAKPYSHRQDIDHERVMQSRPAFTHVDKREKTASSLVFNSYLSKQLGSSERMRGKGYVPAY